MVSLPGGIKVPQAERDELARLLTSIRSALDAARSEVAAGRVPGADELEGLRAALLTLLSKSALGLALDRVQRYLRADLFQLVAALRTPGIAATALVPLLEQQSVALEAAARQAGAVVGGATSKAGGRNFWESSI